MKPRNKQTINQMHTYTHACTHRVTTKIESRQVLEKQKEEKHKLKPEGK